MDVNSINKHLLDGDWDLTALFPHLEEYQQRSLPLPFEFGLNELPKEPGFLAIRGPRQYGKSTWLELNIAETVEEFGKGSALYLNGDDLAHSEELFSKIEELALSFPRRASVKRIFIDEITAVNHWEKAIKRAADRGITRNILLITTGSKAADLRHGQERLPGRKGKLDRTDYIFLPCSYRAFYTNTYRELGHDTWKHYLLSGGSPLTINEMWHRESVPEFTRQITRDWIFGEILKTGRNRTMLLEVLRCLFRFGGSPVGFAKLARESGLANNTVASGYIEELADLMCVLTSWQIDAVKNTPLVRKPCKFPMINLSAALAFHPNSPRNLFDLEHMSGAEKGILIEWLVAQELWRRRVLKGVVNHEEVLFWKSDKYELDFIDENGNFVEVKSGRASALEFAWFPKIFPKKKLTVICTTPFETEYVQGVTIHQFLLRDPYFKAYVTDVPENPEEY